jgi:hypothetical protein
MGHCHKTTKRGKREGTRVETREGPTILFSWSRNSREIRKVEEERVEKTRYIWAATT